MKKLLISIFVLVIAPILVSFIPLSVIGAEIGIAWDANTEPDLAGYKIYYGLSSCAGQARQDCAFDDVVDVGNVTTHRLQITQDGDYFCAATAYDEAGNESEYSNEVTFVVDTTAPSIVLNFRLTSQKNIYRITVDKIK